MQQIKKYNPPPNPAKITDSRCKGYIEKYGNESWELDALEPKVITSLITKAVEEYIDEDLYGEVCDLEEGEREELHQICRHYDTIAAVLKAEEADK
jgi:hypothetical protein